MKYFKIITTVLLFSLSLIGCSKKNENLNQDQTEDFVFTNYDIGMNWQIHKNIYNLDNETIKYYAVKQNLISKVELLILEDYAMNGIILDKNDVSFSDFIKDPKYDGEIKDFYNAMKTSEADLSNFVYSYIKEKYPSKTRGTDDSEAYFEKYVKEYFHDINDLNSNHYLKNECCDYLASFNLSENGWINYNYKDRFYYHIEDLSQFLPNNVEVGIDNGYCLTYEDESGKDYTLLQNFQTGEIILITDNVKINDLISLNAFDFSQYEIQEEISNDNEDDVEVGTIDDRENADNVFITSSEKIEDENINSSVQNAWDNSTFTIREDEVKITAINTVDLVNRGYIWGSDENGRFIYKTDGETGRSHIIRIIEK